MSGDVLQEWGGGRGWEGFFGKLGIWERSTPDAAMLIKSAVTGLSFFFTADPTQWGALSLKAGVRQRRVAGFSLREEIKAAFDICDTTGSGEINAKETLGNW